MKVSKPNEATLTQTVVKPEIKAVSEAPIKTAAMAIWDDIKDRQLEMFGLPGQTVAKYCSPVFAHPEKLYLNYKVGAVLSALETAFKNKYDIEQAEKFITVRAKSQPFSR